MKVETKTIYKCEHCNKLYQLKRFAELHEKRCSKNPDNDRACFGCNHLVKKKTIIYSEGYYGEEERFVDVMYCKHFEKFLYPPKNEHKENWFDLGDECNEPMPRQCDQKDDESIEMQTFPLTP